MFRQCLERFSVDNMKKTGLYGYVFEFLVDYYIIYVDDILDIHKYLTKKKHKTIFGFIENIYWIIKRLVNKKFW